MELGDRLLTGPGARLEVKFTDNTVLTLARKADFTIDELSVGKESGAALFTRKAGAMLLAGGDIAKLPVHKIEIASNAGTIGIRGTVVWGGVVKDKSLLDVFLIEGAVEVRTPGGTVVLDKPGLGTSSARSAASRTTRSNGNRPCVTALSRRYPSTRRKRRRRPPEKTVLGWKTGASDRNRTGDISTTTGALTN